MRYMVTQYTQAQYELLESWWHFHQAPSMPMASIPETSYFSCSEAGEPLAFVSLYLTNSNIAWGETLVTRPNLPREERKQAVAEVLSHIKMVCAQMELVLLALSDSASVNFHLEKAGFTKDSKGYYLHSISNG